MDNLRYYGKGPFSIAVVHGGPGAAGEMAAVARELAGRWGVLEPLQTAVSVEGQVQELKTTLEKNADLPVRLVGFSWGAWLSFIVAARYLSLVGKLILVASAPFEEKYAARVQQTRLDRLSEADRTEARSVIELLDNPAAEHKNAAFVRLGALFSKADAYDEITCESPAIDCRVDIFQRVWPDAAKMRKSGGLLELSKNIECPVVAIHGDYDPHPAEGVQRPLCAVLRDFRFILLANCGHKPWIERQAKDKFYEVLRRELCYPIQPDEDTDALEP